MAQDPNLNFDGVLNQLIRLEAIAANVGDEFDKMGVRAKTSGSGQVATYKDLVKVINNVEGQMKHLMGTTSGLDQVFDSLRSDIRGLFSGFYKDSIQAATAAKALKDNTSELHGVIKNTALNKNYVNWVKSMTVAEQDAAMATESHKQKLELLNTTIGRNRAITESQVRGQKQQVTAAQDYTNQITKMRSQLAAMNSQKDGELARLRAEIKARRDAAAALEKYNRATSEQAARQAMATNGYGAKTQFANAAVLGNTSYSQINSQLRDLSQYSQKATSNLRLLSDAEAGLNAAEQRLTQNLQMRNRLTQEQANASNLLSQREAELRARVESVAEATQRSNRATMEAARAQFGLSEAQKSASAARDNELKRLERLRSEVAFLTSERGREAAAIQRQINQQQAYNRMLAMSTTELLGFSKAQDRANRSMALGNQATAAYRATLAGMQSTFGMFTSSTILVASGAFAVASGIRQTISVGMEFTDTMARVNAIMSHVGQSQLEYAANSERMASAVRGAAQTSVFTATEAAEGMQQLVMAGQSANEAIVALTPTLNVAAIANTTMGEAADIVTNIMSQFSIQAEGLTEVVDIMATAVTNSNTTMGQLATALNYVGPTAQIAGYGLRDVTSALETLANSGIKASIAGTGLRRLIMSLNAPTSSGAAMLDKYAISLTNMDGSARDLVDVMGQLNQALIQDGVSASEKMAAITDLVGVRASAATAALISNADAMRIYRQELDNVAGSSADMAKKSLDSLAGDVKLLGSAFEENLLKAFEAVAPMLRMLTARLTVFLTELTTSDIEKFISYFTTLGASLQGVVEPITSLAGSVSNLLPSLQSLTSIVGPLIAMFASLKATSVAGNIGAGLGQTAQNLANTFGILKDRATQAHTSLQGYTQAQITATRATTAASAATATQAAAQGGLVANYKATMATLQSNITQTTAYANIQNVANTAMAGGAKAGQLLSTAMLGVSVAFNAISKAMAVINPLIAIASTLYFAYVAFKQYFSSSNESAIERQNKLIRESSEEYDRLTSKIDELNLAGRRNELQTSLEKIDTQIKSVRNSVAEVNKLIEEGQQRGDSDEALSALVNARDRMNRSLEEYLMLQRSFREDLQENTDLGGANESAYEKINTAVKAQQVLTTAIAVQQANVKKEMIETANATLGLAANGGEVERTLQSMVYLSGELRQGISETSAEFGRMASQSNQALKETEQYFTRLDQAFGLIDSRAARKANLTSTEELKDLQKAQAKIREQLYSKMPDGEADHRLLQENSQYSKNQERIAEIQKEQKENLRDMADLEFQRANVGKTDTLPYINEQLAREKERLQVMKDSGRYEGTADLNQQMQKVVALEERAYSVRNKSNKSTISTTSALEKQADIRADIAKMYRESDGNYDLMDRQLQSQQDLNKLLYDTSATYSQQEATLKRYAANYGNVEATMERVLERSKEINAAEQAAEKYAGQAAVSSAKERAKVEKLVNDRLNRQKELVKEQLSDYEDLVKAQVERNKALLNQAGQFQAAQRQRDLIEAAAQQNRYLSESEAERIMKVQELNVEYQTQVETLKQARLALVAMQASNASDRDIQAQKQLIKYTEQNVGLLEDVIDGTRRAGQEMSIQAQTAKNLSEAVGSYFDGLSEDVTDAIGDGLHDINDMFDSIRQSFADLLVAMAREAFINPIVIGIKNDVMSGMGLNGSPAGGRRGPGLSQGLGVAKKSWDALTGGGGAINWTGAPTTYSGGFAGNATAGMGAASRGTSFLGGSTGNFGGMTGLASAGSGFAGNLAGNTVFGESKYGSTLSTVGSLAGTYFGGPVGAAIGSFVGSGLGKALGGLFGGSKPKPPQFKYHNDRSEWGGRDSALTSSGEFGFSLRNIDDETREALDNFSTTLAESDNALAEYFSPSQLKDVKTALDDFTYKGLSMSDLAADRLDTVLEAANVNGPLYDRMREDYQGNQAGDRIAAVLQISALEKSMKEVPENVLGHIDRELNRFQDQAIGELSSSLLVQINNWQSLGSTLEAMVPTYDRLAAGAVDVTNSLVETAGSLEDLQSLQDQYYQDFFSDQEKYSLMTKNLTTVLEAAGTELPRTVEGMKSLVQGLDLTTEAGRKSFIALTSNSKAIKGHVDQISAWQSAITDQYQKSMDRTPDAAGLEYWMDQVESGASTLENALSRIAGSMEATYGDISGAMAMYSSGATAAISSALQTYKGTLTSLEDMDQTRKKALQEGQNAVDSLGDLLDSLLLKDPSQTASLEAAKYQYDSLYSQAKGGSYEAAQALSEAANEYLSQYGESASSATEYTRVYNQVINGVSELKDQYKRSVDQLGSSTSIEDQQLREQQLARTTLVDQLNAQIGILDGVNNWSDLLASLPESISNELAGIVATPGGRIGNSTLPDGVYTGTQGFDAADSAINSIYNSALGRNADKGGLDYYKQQLASGKTLSQVKADIEWAAKNNADRKKTTPAFASGGVHSGGVRLVGERGPELEVTGPSRIYSNQQTQSIFDLSPVVDQLKAQRDEDQGTRGTVDQILSRLITIANQVQRWEMDGMPPERSST